MATIPDTLDIADSLASAARTSADEWLRTVAESAVERLRVLHALGLTEERTLAQVRAERDAAVARAAQQTAYADATVVANDALRTERDALKARLDALTVTPDGVPITEFRRRLIPLRLGLASAPEAVRARWDRVLPELDHFTTVYPTESPVSDLIAMAQADGLITADQAAALRQV